MGASTVTDGELWIFGYGSLLWDAGFEPVEQVRARLTGYRPDTPLADGVARFVAWYRDYYRA